MPRTATPSTCCCSRKTRRNASRWRRRRSISPIDCRRRCSCSSISISACRIGSSSAPMAESLAALEADGIHLDRMRIRAFPFSDAVAEFIHEHDRVFVVEQNRDAQLRMMLVNECAVAPDKLVPVLHYDGTPLTARFVRREIGEKAAVFNVSVPVRAAG